MHRFEWNNLIGEYLFRPEYSQQPVFLYLSRGKLVELGKSRLPDADEQAIWVDFVRAVHSYTGKEGTLLEKIERALSASFQDRTFNGWFETKFPPCLALLVLGVMPLAEEVEQFKFSTTNYYQRAKLFFEQHGLPSLPNQNEAHNWNRAWHTVARWSEETKGGEWGIFDDTVLSTNAYRYVGKAFAQCLLPASALHELPNAFDRMGWVPGQLLANGEIRTLIVQQGAFLGLKANVLAAVKSMGEVASTVEGLVRREFGRWNGTSKYSRTTVLTPQKNTVVAQQQEPEFMQVSASLRFGFRLQYDYTFDPFYRLFAPQDYPENLIFTDKKGGEWRIEESHSRWSEQIALPFLPEGYNLADAPNRWNARTLPVKLGCRFFIRGDYEGLSKGDWLETQNLLFDGSCMYLLAPAVLPEQLTTWIHGFADGEWKELSEGNDIENIPTGFRVFRFRNPPSVPAWLPNSGQPVQNTLPLTGGLTLNPTTYFRPFPPTVRVEGGTPKEQVWAVLDNGARRIELLQDAEALSLFHFPNDFPDEVTFRLHRAGQSLEDKALLRFTSQLSEESAENFTGWDAFGKRVGPEQIVAVSGLEARSANFNFQHSNLHFFFPGDILSQRHPLHVAESETTPGDNLLHFLSTKSEWSVEAFAEAFGRVSEAVGIRFERMTRRKRYALLDWDALGYLEYEPERKRLYLNQTQLVPVRTERGCRAMLLGRRSPELLQKVKELLPVYPLLQLSIERADETDERLIPCSVFIQSNISAGKAQLEALAGRLQIPFRASELPQFGLLDASATITDFWETVRSSTPCENAIYWKEFARPFCRKSLEFKPGSFDPASALVEYQLQTWQREVRYWQDGVAYSVDRNWTRYAVAAAFQKSVKIHSIERKEFQPIVIKEAQDLAFPLSVPLPRFFARALTLMSGKLPRFDTFHTPEWPEITSYRVYQDASATMTANFLSEKLGQTSTLTVK